MSDQYNGNEHFNATSQWSSGRTREIYYSSGSDTINSASRPASRSSTMNVPVSSQFPPAFRATTSRRGGRSSTPSSQQTNSLRSSPKPPVTGYTSVHHVNPQVEDVTTPQHSYVVNAPIHHARNEETTSLRDTNQVLLFNNNPNDHNQGEIRRQHHNYPTRNQYLFPAVDPKEKSAGVKDLSRLMTPFDPLMASNSADDMNDADPRLRTTLTEDGRHTSEYPFPHMRILPSFSHDEYAPKHSFATNDSVFRNRLDDFGQEEIDAHKILLSLGSSKTFDDTKESSTWRKNYADSDTSGEKESSPVRVLFTSSSLPFGNVSGSHLEYPSSPDEPPQIHLHSSQKAFVFNQPSPIASKTHGIEAMHSFQLFTPSQSFDLIGDDQRVVDSLNPKLKRGKNLESLQNNSRPSAPTTAVYHESQHQAGLSHNMHDPKPFPYDFYRSFQSKRGAPSVAYNFPNSDNHTKQCLPPYVQSYNHGYGQISHGQDNNRPLVAGSFLHGQALSELTFILPRLKENMKQTGAPQPDMSLTSNNRPSTYSELSKDRQFSNKSQSVHVSTVQPTVSRSYNPDLIIARRRIKSAVCAFGGNMRKFGFGEYAEDLSNHFYENNNHLSWECVENKPQSDHLSPPSPSSQELANVRIENYSVNNLNLKAGVSTNTDDKRKSQVFTSPSREHNGYKCKMCGQVKQNHICPAIASFERSIGVMVYPTLNAFTASEPGYLSQSLSNMNNFTSSSDVHSSTDRTPSRLPSTELTRIERNPVHYITPDAALRGGNILKESISISDSMSPQRMAKRQKHDSSIQSKTSDTQADADSVTVQASHLMPNEMNLQPEQYRVAHVQLMEGSYDYPVVPLPYIQRKQLSDYLLALSSSSSQLRDECALVLQEGRQKGMWDLAVAELITQVIMLFHCHSYDVRLDGLSMYLRSMGISC